MTQIFGRPRLTFYTQPAPGEPLFKKPWRYRGRRRCLGLVRGDENPSSRIKAETAAPLPRIWSRMVAAIRRGRSLLPNSRTETNANSQRLLIANRGGKCVRNHPRRAGHGDPKRIRPIRGRYGHDWRPLADEVVLHPAPRRLRNSYLNVDASSPRAKATQADAVHPRLTAFSEKTRLCARLTRQWHHFAALPLIRSTGWVTQVGRAVRAAEAAGGRGARLQRAGSIPSGRWHGGGKRSGLFRYDQSCLQWRGQGHPLLRSQRKNCARWPAAQADAKAAFGDCGFIGTRRSLRRAISEVQIMGDGTDCVHYFSAIC